MKWSSRLVVLIGAIMIGVAGCDPPPPVVIETPAEPENKRDIPLPGHPDSHDYRSLITVKDPGVPGQLLDTWTRFVPVTGKLPIDARPEVLDDIRNNFEVFNSLAYTLNDEMKQAIMEAKKLKWLRVGTQCKGEDLKWIGQLKGLRGLAFVGSVLPDGDFQDLAGLTDLRYLSFGEAVLPAAPVYPDLPKLEFLAVDGKFIKDEQFPANGMYPDLEVFTGTWSELSDEKLAGLIRSWPKLRYIFIARCENITGKSADEFAKLKNLRYLQVGFTKLSTELYDPVYLTAPDLQLQLPNCHIGFGK